MSRYRTFAALILLALPLRAADPPPAQQPGVSGNISAGLSLTRGNSDTKNINLSFDLAQRLSARNVAKYNAFYLRSDENGTLTVDRLSLGARDEVAISTLIFVFADGQYLRDRFKKIDYLVTPAVGGGYHLIKQTDLDLSLAGGLGLAMEKDAGQDQTTSGSFQAKQALHWKLSPTATLTQSVGGIWKINHIGDALIHFETSLASDITARSQLKVALLDDYKSRPVAGVKRNDLSLIAAFVMKF